MDWTAIIITILTLLISNGGLVTLVTLREKKNAAFLDNISKLIDQWQEVANDRKLRADELKSDLDRKDAKIDSLYAEIAKLRGELDHTRTSEAVARMLKCTLNFSNGSKLKDIVSETIHTAIKKVGG